MIFAIQRLVSEDRIGRQIQDANDIGCGLMPAVHLVIRSTLQTFV